MSQQLCSQPLPQPSKELHGVISALGNAQGLCPEWETPCSRLPQHNTQGNPGENAPVPGRYESQQQPQARDCCGTAFPALPHSVRLQQKQHSVTARTRPPAAVTISLLTPQPRWKHRQEQSQLLPREGRGCEQGHDRNSHCPGDKAAMVPTTA